LRSNYPHSYCNQCQRYKRYCIPNDKDDKVIYELKNNIKDCLFFRNRKSKKKEEMHSFFFDIYLRPAKIDEEYERKLDVLIEANKRFSKNKKNDFEAEKCRTCQHSKNNWLTGNCKWCNLSDENELYFPDGGKIAWQTLTSF
jgi:hypothetical protein